MFMISHNCRGYNSIKASYIKRLLFQCDISFVEEHFICAKIIPIPKGSKPALTCSDKYRSIAISNVIGKILDYVIIDRQSDCLKTCNYQFGFKPKACIFVTPRCYKSI